MEDDVEEGTCLKESVPVDVAIELVQAKRARLRSPTSKSSAAGERSVYALVPFSGELKFMARRAIGSEGAGLSSR